MNSKSTACRDVGVGVQAPDVLDWGWNLGSGQAQSDSV